jgi:hypothetical protein
VYERFIGNPVAGYETVIAKQFENRFFAMADPRLLRAAASSYGKKSFQQEALGEYLCMRAGLLRV